MKSYLLILIFFVLFSCSGKNEPGETIDFNFNWTFSLLDSLEIAFANDFDDSEWRNIRLPHDWSIEFPFDSVKGEGATGYLLGGVGWYRKHFNISGQENEVYYILFDGIYNNSEVWVNGQKLIEHPYGYSPFFIDITSALNKEETKNVMAVKVDHSRYADSRWYTGSGIYRDVKLIKKDKLHIPIWGTYITTPKVSEEAAEIRLEIEIENLYTAEKLADIKTQIFAPNGEMVKEIISKGEKFGSSKKIITQNGTIDVPELWSTEKPNLYKAITSIQMQGKTMNTYSTRFGIRSFYFDSDSGFYLNNKNLKIKGVCLHHEAGLVGAAVPKGVWERRIRILKEAGCNAIRSAHNPASEELLEVCDEMGILVQDEFFDEWDYPKDKRLNVWERHNDYISRGYTEHFQQHAEKDLKLALKAHRNHPSVFQWSIGNEIEWTYPRVKAATGYYEGDKTVVNRRWSVPPISPEEIRKNYVNSPAGEYSIETTAAKLAKWTRDMDTTRSVTANCIIPTGSFETGYTNVLDVVGFSYRQVIYDYAKKYYPEKSVMGTENWPQWHEWKQVLDRPFISGVFLWTGVDYLGESHESWPRKYQPTGLLDAAGFKKPAYHMFKCLWNDEPHIYICSNTADESEYKVNDEGKVVEKEAGKWKKRDWYWYSSNEHWNYNEGDSIIVEVISNCDSVELFLNEKSLDVKYLKDFPDRIYKWFVEYQPGTVAARGPKASAQIHTASEPVAIQLSSDKETLSSDGYDVAHIMAQLVDKNGNPVSNAERRIIFSVNGDVRSLGVDNGSPSNPGPYISNTVITNKGKALFIIQSDLGGKGLVNIKAMGNGLKSNIVNCKLD